MKLNLRQLQKRYIVLLLLLVVFLPVPFRMKGMTKLEITGLDGTRITTDAYTLTADHELMLDKEIAERALGARIGWEKQAPLPTGVYYKDQVAVLMYHHLAVAPLTLYPGVLTVGQFDEQLRLLKQEGFHIITMQQYRQFMLENAPVPDNAVLLTFDDGYESFYKLAFPILQKHGCTAVNFIIVSDVDHPNKHQVPKLTWEQMRGMKRAGMDFYNHTYNLHYYGIVDAEGGTRPAASALLYIDDENRNELNEEYYRRVTGDLAHAERRLKEELGNTDSAIAFPYGSYNDKLLEASDSLGIRLKFNIGQGLSSRTTMNAPRINEGDRTLAPALSIERLKHPTPPMVLSVNSAPVHLTGAPPKLRKGRLMVPIDALSKALGVEMQYDRSSGSLKLTHSRNKAG
ncbi:polysaccharide deacetylase family protein [Paenibacillus tritici]|uniref:polysaccharide deacetylase family protein n=1 Tax=Paenibacillus tritici TaxID=1873425 RepID=UPI001BA676E4|nr:polysaccharide deacetylase family protein [Paenibacillus tritici]QUL54749.1 polysaccharide deacetylase family protein [Paenibacillus tritici]